MWKQLQNICFDNRMHSHVSLMQVVGELCRQKIMATKDAGAAQCIHQQRICPERIKGIVCQSLLQSATKVNGNMWWKNSRNLCDSLPGWQKQRIFEPGKLHAQLQKGHAHMMKPVDIAGWVADTAQGAIKALHQLMNKRLGRHPNLSMTTLEVGREVG